MSTTVTQLLADEARVEELLKDPGFSDPKLPKGVFSYSQYNAYKLCGEAYRRKYLEKKPWNGNVFTVRGKAIHSGIEHALREKMANRAVTLEEGLDAVRKDYDESSLQVEDWGETNPKELKGKVEELYKVWHRLALPVLNPRGVEVGFAAKVGDVPMTGYIDLITEDPAINVAGAVKHVDMPTKFVIHDTKTSEKSWSEDQVLKNPQLTLYSMVSGSPYVAIDLLLLVKQPTFKIMTATRGRQEAAVLTEDINDVAAAIKRGDFPKTQIDNWACGPRCQYWSECRGKKR
jgi:hypothetical protein